MASTSCSVKVAGETGLALAKLSLPPPRPKSPPPYPDLYGKRREAARVQMLEREIGLQPSSRCCKEVSDFVVANSDPMIPAFPCLSVASFCCCCRSECSCHLRKPKCCNSTCCSCVGSKCFNGSCCSNSCCCPKPSCPKCLSCPSCSCFRGCCCCPKPSCPSCSCFRGCCCSCPDLCCCIPTSFRSCRRPSCINKKSSCCSCNCNCKIKWASCFKCPELRLCCCFCNCKNTCSNPCCLAF
ncbi:hypothetical protein IGI04_005116 [Brassica rapa subsp. trilocularis]|uniref:Uncharacterized protein n=1 Tax=Brassica rapa subsp. trilocularis TaxID=1813537 RepID=A0ABQ7ND29_BRACM|nr:hypothetical protein IGI04_005116 [Brassica rapa subsp. trilocularis]